MQNYKEINGNDYVKDSRTTINETMRSIQSMNSGTVFPTTNLFEGMKCYRTDLKKTYTLTDVENNTWVEDAHAELADEATHAASATKLQTARSLNLGGAVTADAATFDGTADTTINVKTLDATKLKGTASVSTTGNAATATKATQDTNGRAFTDTNAYMHISALANNTDFNNVKTTGIYYCTGNTYSNRPHNAWGILTVYSIGTVKQEYRPGNVAVYYTREYNNAKWGEWSKVAASTADSATKATNDSNGANIASTYVKKAGDTTTGKITFVSTDLNSLPEVKKTSDDNMSGVRFSSKTKFLGAVGKRLSNGEDLLNLRSNNNTTDVVLDSRNYGSYALPKSGGTMSGALNFANSTWNLVGDDSYMGDHNISGTFCVNGANGETGIALFKQGSDSDYARISYNGGNINFNKKITANLAGNADTATTATNVSGKIYYSADSPSVATDKLFTIKQAHGGDDNVPNNGLVIQTGPTGTNYNGKLYITDNGGDGVWVGGVAAGKEVGWKRLVENWGSWNINSATATKLATARTISLTGNASGSAAFDGSGNVEINTTNNYAAASGVVNNGGDQTAITGREANGLRLNQVYNNGYPTSYGNVLTIGGKGGGQILAGWSGADKGIERLYYRNRRDAITSWSDWRAVAFTSDFDNYPTKTGTGASGTWGINITGNANTWGGLTLDSNTENNTDTWIPVFSNGKLQHTTKANMTVGGANNADKLDGYHASDIIGKITAANTGGIVAASLTENGYVKFANGLILQWGNASGENEEADNSTTFPIAFPSTCFVVLLTSKRYIASNRLLSQSKTGFTWTVKSGLISWAALGM